MSLVRNSFWVLVSMLASRGVVVLSGIAIANFLGAASFATFAFIHTTVASTSIIATAGMMNGVPRFFAQFGLEPSRSTLAKTVLALGMGGGGILLAAAVLTYLPSSVIGLPNSDYHPHLIALTITLGFANLLIAATEGLEQFRKVSLVTLLMSLIMSAGVAFSVASSDLEYAISGYIGAALIVIFALGFHVFRLLLRAARQSGLAIEKSDFRSVAVFSGPIFVSSALTNSALWLVGRKLVHMDPEAKAFAEFALGMQWFGLASMASIVVGRVVLPRLTRSALTGHAREHSANVMSGVRLSLIGSAVVLLVVVLLCPVILSFYGAEFRSATPTLIVFTAAAMVAAPISTLSSDLISRGHYWVVLKVVAFWWFSLMALVYIPGELTASGATQIVLFSYLLYLACALLATRLTVCKP